MSSVTANRYILEILQDYSENKMSLLKSYHWFNVDKTNGMIPQIITEKTQVISLV